MAAKEGLTTQNDILITAREVDFVQKFTLNWEHLRQILGIMRPIRMAPGTHLISKYAEVTLKDGNIAEGEEIPYSEASVKQREYDTIDVQKYAKAVTLEAIKKWGYDAAVNMTDEQFRFELQTVVTERFYDYIKTGLLRSSTDSFQMALAMAQGLVRNKWKSMHRGITQIVGFANILDVYEYIGAANITVQNQFGLNYVENFIGYSKLFLLSDAELDKGVIIATPIENIVLYYVSPSDGDFAKAGLQYTTIGDTGLIGYHVQGNYQTAVSESFALMGMTLFSEYIDGIAVIDINNNAFTDATIAAEQQSTKVFNVDVSDLQDENLNFASSGVVTGTVKWLTGDNAITNVWGDGNFIAFKISGIPENVTSVKVGLTPSEGTGLIEIIDDPDKNGIFKISDKDLQKFTVVMSDGVNKRTKYFDLSKLTLETANA